MGDRLWSEDDITFLADRLSTGGAAAIREFLRSVNNAVPPWMAKILKKRLSVG